MLRRMQKLTQLLSDRTQIPALAALTAEPEFPIYLLYTDGVQTTVTPVSHLELSLGACISKHVHSQLLKTTHSYKQKRNYRDTKNLPGAGKADKN